MTAEASKHSPPGSPTLKVEDKKVDTIPLKVFDPKSSTKGQPAISFDGVPESTESDAVKKQKMEDAEKKTEESLEKDLS